MRSQVRFILMTVAVSFILMTPFNVARGVLLFEDSFDSGPLSPEWIPIKSNQWIQDGWLHTKSNSPFPLRDSVAAVHDNDQTWTDYTYSVLVDPLQTGNWESADLYFRTSNIEASVSGLLGNYYRMILFAPGHGPGPDYNRLRFGRRKGGSGTLLFDQEVDFLSSDPMQIEIRLEGPQIQVFFDGQKRIDIIDPDPLLFGGIGIGAVFEAEARFDNVSVSVLNQPPIAEAGLDQTVYVGDQVMLDGSESDDPDGDSLTYTWSFVSKPTGSQSYIDDPTAVQTSFVADVVGDYVVNLVVNDGTVDSDPDTVTLTVLNTPVGQNVEVSVPETGTTMLFDNVVLGGVTTVTITQNGPPPPTGLKLVPLGTYYEINTTALFTGMIHIAIEYDDTGLSQGQENVLKLRVYEVATDEWVNITTSLDTVNNIIYGTTNHLLFFAITTRIPVEIDIKPDNYPNVINLGSQGVIPVAILSSCDFDATTVNPDTVELAGSGVAVRGKGDKYLSQEEDVNGDGLLDLVCKVETENLDPDSFQDGYAILTGETHDGVSIVGSDEITIVPSE